MLLSYCSIWKENQNSWYTVFYYKGSAAKGEYKHTKKDKLSLLTLWHRST